MKFTGSKAWVALLVGAVAAGALFTQCTKQEAGKTVLGSAAEKVYVAPGDYDDFYAFMSGGFSGQVSVYGLPSGRLFRIIPVFAQNAENGYGYTEESKAMLMTR